MCSSSCYSSWLAMELNLILLIPIIVYSRFSAAKFSGVKYLIIQRISGIMILILFIVRSITLRRRYWLLILNLFFILKLGAAPFYQWVLVVGENQRWWRVYLILTLQKIVPLYFLQLLGCKSLIIVRVLSFLILPFLILEMKSLKKIVIISSTYTIMRILVAILLISYKWKTLIILYSVSLSPLIGIRGLVGGSLIRPKVQENKIVLIIWLLVIWGLLGVPPLPGFLLKLDISLRMIHYHLWGYSAVFNLSSGILMYIYINIIILKVVSSPRTLRIPTSVSPSLKILLLIISFTWVLF